VYYESQEKQRLLVHDCFNENRERDCFRCPANYARKGICCFGDPDQHDIDTEDCRKCVFVDDCAAEVRSTKREEARTIEREAQRQNRWEDAPRTTYRTVPINRPSGFRPVEKSNLVQIGVRRPSVITPATSKKDLEIPQGETLFQRFVKDTVWGMGQGFFETAAEFFRTRRLP
jgi:hypothetical protein